MHSLRPDETIHQGFRRPQAVDGNFARSNIGTRRDSFGPDPDLAVHAQTDTRTAPDPFQVAPPLPRLFPPSFSRAGVPVLHFDVPAKQMPAREMPADRDTRGSFPSLRSIPHSALIGNGRGAGAGKSNRPQNNLKKRMNAAQTRT